jgi:tripartite-type tricarboxylate transporter receptor subunit TctC
MLNRRKVVLSFALALAATGAVAEGFPSKPLRLVIGYPPGGGSDVIGRTVAQKLGEQLGQVVVVDNKPGANGNLAAEQAARLPHDGYHLLLISVAHAINASLYSNLRYDLVKDFTPVALIGAVPNTIVVNPSLGVDSVKALVAMAKAQPGKISYASSGVGSPEHLAGEMFKSIAGVDLVHVPYKGSGQSVIDLAAGHVKVGFNTLPSVLGQAKSGTVKVLAVTSRLRSAANPEIPTTAEAGLDKFVLTTWYALVAPAATPPAIVKLLNAEVNRALASADVKERLAGVGTDIETTTPEELGVFIRREIERMRAIVQKTGARAD